MRKTVNVVNQTLRSFYLAVRRQPDGHDKITDTTVHDGLWSWPGRQESVALMSPSDSRKPVFPRCLGCLAARRVVRAAEDGDISEPSRPAAPPIYS